MIMQWVHKLRLKKKSCDIRNVKQSVDSVSVHLTQIATVMSHHQCQ